MKFEYRLPLCDREWKPLKSISEMGAAREIATLRDMYDVQVRDAVTHKLLELSAPYGRNAGRMCDVSRGPCCCGAWH